LLVGDSAWTQLTSLGDGCVKSRPMNINEKTFAFHGTNFKSMMQCVDWRTVLVINKIITIILLQCSDISSFRAPSGLSESNLNSKVTPLAKLTAYPSLT